MQFAMRNAAAPMQDLLLFLFYNRIKVTDMEFFVFKLHKSQGGLRRDDIPWLKNLVSFQECKKLSYGRIIHSDTIEIFG